METKRPSECKPRWWLAVPAGGMAVLLAGCAPFINEAFTGSDAVVSRDPAARDVVDVCYNSAFTTPRAVVALARAECVRRDRNPKFLGQLRFQCRLLAPTLARFECVEQ
ncbi:MAG: hypothetical protein FD149_1730 [Rhodospirillaceae bacterium]|nr:MAG: hypothetical protein FD149_1730 [Rhodospirillaceae bacterium]